jgi:ATP-dependent DNA helicase DinG
MAGAVEQALKNDRVLLCEAGTGTGKTLAYLVPAILSGKKVVISTATRALQEQIFASDLPLIQRALGLAPRAALMKGISNYLCRRRYAEFQVSPESLRPRHARSLENVAAWVRETETGDLAELAGIAEDDPIRFEIGSSSDTRLGAACDHYEACFVTQMRRDAEAARLVVVNHHLFFADLALRGPHPGRVIPDYDAVIFDEAHQLEDVATEFFGIRVSQARIEQMLREAERALALAGMGDALFSGAKGMRSVEQARASAERFWSELARLTGSSDRVTLERDVWAGDLEGRYHELDCALEAISETAASARGRLPNERPMPGKKLSSNQLSDALEMVARRAELLREQMAAIVSGGPERVTWLDRGTRSMALSSSPVDLSHLLKTRVFESVPSVIMTSATLATVGKPKAEETSERGPFSYFRSRVGLEGESIDVKELVLESPFDFEKRALLYTPRDLPSPAAPHFAEAAAERIAELIEITQGGCFVLTTSVRAMRELHTLLAARFLGRLRVFVQGSLPKAALLSAFKAAGNAVLVATMSFWEGVDVPGRALRLVVLEKIPFSVPSDPIIAARSAALEALGENAFMKLHVPAAAITLKQGFGRLIRKRTDAGIVTLLDERVHRRGYGKRLLEALPPARRATELGAVREFWQAIEQADGVSQKPVKLVEAPRQASLKLF